MALQAYDDFVARVANGYWMSQPIWDEIQTATTALLAAPTTNCQRCGYTRNMPSPLPSGVTAYIPTKIAVHWAGADILRGLLVAKMISLGSLNIATPTFTDGSAMPTVTELGVSRSLSSAILAEVTTVLNATPGSLTVTYVDQDGNTAETTTADALTASAAVRSCAFVKLNSPDWGARDITAASRTGGTTPTGAIQFWGLIPIMFVSCNSAQAPNYAHENLLLQHFNPARLGAGDRVGCFVMGATATKCVQGDIFIVGDN